MRADIKLPLIGTEYELNYPVWQYCEGTKIEKTKGIYIGTRKITECHDAYPQGNIFVAQNDGETVFYCTKDDRVSDGRTHFEGGSYMNGIAVYKLSVKSYRPLGEMKDKIESLFAQKQRSAA